MRKSYYNVSVLNLDGSVKLSNTYTSFRQLKNILDFYCNSGYTVKVRYTKSLYKYPSEGFVQHFDFD